ncbi:MAG: hypothetical protein DRN29_07285 [Thermoplasmata archaeon]|nr:MAG: hypothetical protein DRN29_07285 [Thermoplasmata archaeon]
MNKVSFAFASIAILLAASILPSVGSENVSPVISNEKTIEVPFKIYTLHGVKEIKKELPINKAKELLDLFNETREAVKLLNSHATFKEKMEANAIIDSLLYKMKENGLLGNLSIKEAKELITGKYFQKEKNNIEARRLAMMANVLSQSGWEVNAMCYFNAWGDVRDFFIWNVPLFLLSCLFFENLLILVAILDAIPHPTTVGYWIISRAGIFAPSGGIYIRGLLGEERIDLEGTETIKAITLGFTGINIFLTFAIGFCPFIAMK